MKIEVLYNIWYFIIHLHIEKILQKLNLVIYQSLHARAHTLYKTCSKNVKMITRLKSVWHNAIFRATCLQILLRRIALCITYSQSSSLTTALNEVESSFTLRKDCGNAATHFEVLHSVTLLLQYQLIKIRFVKRSKTLRSFSRDKLQENL